MRTSFSAPAGGFRLSAPPRAEAGARPWVFPWVRVFVPDLALVASVVTLFYALFLFQGYQAFFRDSDAGWHIRNGERILASGSLPHTDPFSFTMAGRPWFAWEWLSDIAVGTIHQNWGLTGVAFFYGCAIAACVWLWFRINWIAGGNFLLAAAFAAPMLSTANLHWLARPHLLSWIFLLLTILFAETATAFTPARAIGVALVTGLWTNLHASFFLGPVILLIYAIGAAAGNLVAGPSHRPKPLLLYAAISAAATLLNPFGFHLHQHVFHYVTDISLLDRIGEFQTFNFHAEGAGQIVLALGIAALGGLLALTQKNLPVAFLSAFLITAALRSARGLPLVALLLLPLANGAITRGLAAWSGLRPNIRRALDNFLAYSNRLRILDARCSGIVWAPVAALLFLSLLRTPAIAARTGFPPDQFPVAASAAVEKLPITARLLAPDKFGGYLIYRFDARRKVFFDGRSDLYGAEFLKQYGRMVQVRPGWRQILDSFQFTHALLPNDYSLIPALEQIGWKPLYHDNVATLLSRPQ
ncbi:MAG: hypothetical protein JWO80_257 [Bryobacterales bacterium]|nr:hypothetical protein [Bryobacterales bacterium]